MLTDDDQAAAAFFVAELAELDRAGLRIVLDIGPWTGYSIIGWLQLLQRANNVLPAMRDTQQKYIDAFSAWFKGTPGEETIRHGSDPAYDVEADDPVDPAIMKWLYAIIDLERAGETSEVRFSHVDAFFFILMMQAVCRAPRHLMNDRACRHARELVEPMREVFAGTYGDQFIRAGNHERFVW